MSVENDALIFAEMRPLLAEKRTHLATLRTGVAVCTLPLSIVTVLIATSKLYDILDIFYPYVLLLCLCIFLLAFGVYLILKSFHRIRLCDKNIEKMKRNYDQKKITKELEAI